MGEQRELDAVVEGELLEDVRDVRLDGRDAHVQLGADLGVGLAEPYGHGDLAFAFGQQGELLASGALILLFAFLVLSTSPGYEVKPLAIGIAAGIIFDATVIRALLVPALMRLMGEANWWMPSPVRRVLRLPAPVVVSGVMPVLETV